MVIDAPPRPSFGARGSVRVLPGKLQRFRTVPTPNCLQWFVCLRSNKVAVAAMPAQAPRSLGSPGHPPRANHDDRRRPTALMRHLGQVGNQLATPGTDGTLTLRLNRSRLAPSLLSSRHHPHFEAQSDTTAGGPSIDSTRRPLGEQHADCPSQATEGRWRGAGSTARCKVAWV